MTGPAAPAKMCIHCGEDCSARPRTKDAQGRYACKECHEQAMAAAAARRHAPEPKALPIQDDGAFAASLAAGVKVEAPATQMCTSCGAITAIDAVVCTTCGFNKMTGKHLKVKQRSAKADAAIEVASKVSTGSAQLVFCVVAGLIAGAIGATVWAAVSYHVRYEVGYIAWGIGAGVGAAVYGVARGFAGSLTGIIAVAIALLSVAAGKYASVSMEVDDFTGEVNRISISDQDMQMRLAYGVVEEWEQAKKRMTWAPGMDAETAEKPEDFPKPVWAEAMKRWDAKPADVRESERQAAEEEIRQIATAFKDAVKEEGFAQSFTPYDILWAVLAIASAYGIGSGMKADE